MVPHSFITENRDGVLWMRLNRPERMNAITFEVYRELRDYFAYLQSDSKSHVVVLTGTGKGFCSGGDVKDIIGELVKMSGHQFYEFTKMTCDVIGNIRSLKKPIIAAVNGVAAGAGACLALACDLRICSENARFAFLFPKVGLSGADMGAAFLLPRVVGLGRAAELLFTGDMIDSAEAYRIGLANKVVKPDELEKTVSDLAEKIKNGPRFAHSMTKETFNKELSMNLEQAMEFEAQTQSICMAHPDFMEAYRAYVEKRPPKFNA